MKKDEIAYHLSDSDAKAYFCFAGTPDLPMGQMGYAGFQEATDCEHFFMIMPKGDMPSSIEGTANRIVNLSQHMYSVISNSTADSFIQTVKMDHVVWKLEVYQVMLCMSNKSFKDFADHTMCRLGQWYYQGEGQGFHDELGQIFGLKPFLAGNTGAQAGGWFRKEITGPEDFNGLKFRMPGMGGQALGKLGASIQNLPGSEVYQALASGAIDGTEWIGPWADEKAGFQEITKFYYTAGFHEPGAALTLATNRDVFDSLSPAHQKIIETAAGECHQWNLAQFLNNNGAALQRLQAGGVQTLEFPDSVWDAFGAAAKETLDGYMDDELFAKIRGSVEASMKASSGWLVKSEGAYRAQRDRIMG